MKITMDREGLLRACQLVAQAAAARSVTPILANVKATAEGDGLTLVAQDLEIGIRYQLRGVQVQRTGEAILHLATLLKILRECDADKDVTITATDDGSTAMVGSSRFEMPGFPVNEYPDLPEFADDGRYHEIKAGDLQTMIRRTCFATDNKDSTRFALSGILWEAEGKRARLVGTDSKRLAVCEVAATLYGEAPKTKGNHLIPRKAMKLLDANLSDAGELVRVALQPNAAQFQLERATIYTRLIEGRYPPYRDIVSQSRKAATKKIPLPVGAFLSRVRQAAIMANDEACRVDFTFTGSAVVLKANGVELGASHVEMALTSYQGEEVTISFDPEYLTEFLRVLDPATLVVLELADRSKPALFKAGDDYSYLVMPLSA